jgi:D-alanyl-D-alanine carboxypeptidase/D-alanyl-D-alanine-endopeptidase (penicillin-binding protein 4)
MMACSPVVREISSYSENNQYHAGFYLYDLEKNKVLADYQGDKYFTPASNTKILTLYAVKQFLPDPLPMFYIQDNDSVTYLWPTGNPEFLNPILEDSTNYFALSRRDSIVLMHGSFAQSRFGSGWAWDDYNYSDSPELTAFPIYGNLAKFNLDTLTNQVSVVPDFLQDSLILEQGERFGVTRMESSNIFKVTIGECKDCQRIRPYRITKEMVAALYSDTLKIPVAIDTLAKPTNVEILYGQVQDSVLKVMMQESDNFLAEHLLLQVGEVLTDTLESQIAIDTIQSYLQQFLPDSAIWVDGSGLSRYNMITPRSVVFLWKELIDLVGEERLKQIVAEGGVSGTIENWYGGNPSYLYGKTGTLRHNHNLSGMLIAKSGKTLLFSFMHNHFTTSSTPVKEEMERVLRMIYEKY